LLNVLDEALAPPRIILLRGPAAALGEWTAVLTPKLGPRDLLLTLPPGLKLPAALAKPESSQPAAWICSGTACLPPVTELSAVMA
jgi:uncharacterized protein YyaL (SSP411 family)